MPRQIPEHAALSQESMINPALRLGALGLFGKQKATEQEKRKFCFLLGKKMKQKNSHKPKQLLGTVQTELHQEILMEFCCCIWPHGRFSRSWLSPTQGQAATGKGKP